MRDEAGPEFSEEFIREVVEALATVGAKNGQTAISTRRRPEMSLPSAPSVAINLEGVPIAEAFGPSGIFSKPSEAKKFWESDLGRTIIRYFYLILLVAGHHYEDHPAGVREQKIQQLIELLAKQYQEFRIHEISPQFQPTPEPDPIPIQTKKDA
jgi:hypothetical protein